MRKCSFCNYEAFTKLIDLGKQPFANKYPKKEQFKNEIRTNLTILICQNCFSAKTESIASRNVMFEEYFYLSSVNNELVKHFNELSNMIPENSKVLDIGSNDGILLRPLIKKKIKALGIDPSVNVGKIANDDGLPTIIGFFDDQNTQLIYEKYGKFDYIIASSIFTHVISPDDFIKNLKKILKIDGTFILEIEYIKNILSGLEFERFYFDRPFYYSILGVKELFSKHNLFINKIEEITPHGGSLRFFISFKKENEEIINHYISKEKNYFKELLKDNFQIKSLNEAKNLKNFLIEMKKLKKKSIAFGCPARFATITNFIDITPDLLPYVIDDNPIKQNKFSPGKHIPIKDRGFIFTYKPDLIIVFAYEYFDSIFDFTKQFDIPHYKPIPLKKLS